MVSLRLRGDLGDVVMRAFGRVIFCLAVAVFLSSSVEAQHNSQRGAAVGGVAGAVAGGLIGEHNDEPLAGAVIGGALGAVTGAVIGDAKDQDIALARQQAQAYAQARAQAVTFENVIQMSQAGLSESVISNEIRRWGVQKRPNVPEIIMLHENGVSDTVIAMLQTAPTPVVYSRVAPVPVAPAPIIVERCHPPVRYYVAPRPLYHYHYHPRRQAHRGGRIGFSFGF